MSTGKQARCLVLLAILAAGCKTARPEPQIAVHVIDAETKAPIAGATVRLTDLRDPFTTKNLSIATAADGKATVRVMPEADDGLMEVTKTGYLTEAVEVHDAKLAEIDPAAKAKDRAQPQSMEVELFAGPRPTVELVVPTTFRGLIKAEFKIAADAPSQGVRTFRYDVPADGAVSIAGPAVLHCVTPLSFKALAPDGTPLPTEGQPTDIFLRWVKTTDTIDYFVYGTLMDCNEARRMLNLQDNGRGGSGSGGKGKGGKGGGRRGGGGMSGGPPGGASQ